MLRRARAKNPFVCDVELLLTKPSNSSGVILNKKIVDTLTSPRGSGEGNPWKVRQERPLGWNLILTKPAETFIHQVQLKLKSRTALGFAHNVIVPAAGQQIPDSGIFD